MGLQKKISAKEAKAALAAAAFQIGDKVTVKEGIAAGFVGAIKDRYFSVLDRGRLRYVVRFGRGQNHTGTFYEEELKNEKA